MVLEKKGIGNECHLIGSAPAENQENKRCANNKKAIYFRGGRTAHTVTGYLRQHGIDEEILYIVDDAYLHSFVRAVPEEMIIPYSVYREKYYDRSVVVYGAEYYSLKKKLIAQKRVPQEAFYDLGLVFFSGVFLDWNRAFYERYAAQFQQTYEMLADRASKDLLEQWINANLMGDNTVLMEELRTPDQYFNALTSGRMDTYIDCGAFDGDSVKAFLACYGTCEQIIAIEPDENNFKKLQAYLQGLHGISTQAFQKGAWSETTVLRFIDHGDMSSSIDEQGASMLPVMAIDDCDLHGHRASFIKMDIEGSELAALHGAEETIRRDQPILAICAYHRREDLITIPQWIDRVSDGCYEYHLRFHGNGYTELVFYAVPKK